MDNSKLVSASVATILAIGMLVVFVPAQSGVSVREKWRAENQHAAGARLLPVSTARGLRSDDAASRPVAVRIDQISYIRRPAPVL